jgi:hypothetical protein
VFPFPDESAVVVPLVSEYPHRPRRPVAPAVISLFFALRICAPVRATFQIRVSSISPAKKPAATAPAAVEVIALPTAACWIDVDSGVKLPTVSVRSSFPSR